MAEKSVLLVEDEDNIAMALGYLIRKLGYELRRVADGNDALAAIEERAPDLVVLDVMLPGRSGFEVCQIVRRDPALATMKILMITARGGAVEKRKGFAMGADLPLFEEVAPSARQVTTSSGKKATVGPKASFGTLSSGGLY